MVSNFALRSLLSQPLATLCSRKEAASELAALEFPPLWATCLYHRAGRDPKTPILTSHVQKNKQTCWTPQIWSGTHVRGFPVPAAGLVYFFNMFVSAMAQPVLTLEHLKDEPKKSQKNGLFLEQRHGAARAGGRFQANSEAEFWLVLHCLFPFYSWEPKGLQWDFRHLGFSRTMINVKNRTFNHKITGSPFHSHWIHPKPQLPPSEFKPQPDPLDQPRNGGVRLSTCPAPLLAAAFLSACAPLLSLQNPAVILLPLEP